MKIPLRLIRMSALASLSMLLSSCDKIPFLNTSEDKGTPPASGKMLEPAHPEKTSGVPDAQASKKKSPGTPKEAHILYVSPQPLPVGSIALTTIDKTHKARTTYDAGNGKPPTITDSVVVSNKVYGSVVDSDNRVTIHIKTDVEKEQTGNGAAQQINNPLDGQVATLILSDREWQGRLESDAPSEAQRSALKAMLTTYNNPDDAVIFGPQPRRVGDSWEIDASTLPSFKKPGYHVQPGGSLKVKFVSVTEHDGHRYALVETLLDVYVLITDPGVTDPSEEGVIKSTIKASGKSITYRSLVYGMPLSKQVNLKIATKRVVPNEYGYGVASSVGTMVENHVTELELHRQEKSADTTKEATAAVQTTD